MREDERGQSQLVPVAAGAALGLGIFAVLNRRPAEAAADTEKLDHLIDLIEEMARTQEDILHAIKDLSFNGVFPDSIKTPWIGGEPVRIYQGVIASAGSFLSDIMLNFNRGKRLSIRAESGLDQAVTLQMVGNFTDSKFLTTNIGLPVVCPAGGQVSLGLGTGGDWQPYIGMVITVPVAPTPSILTIWAVIQE